MQSPSIKISKPVLFLLTLSFFIGCGGVKMVSMPRLQSTELPLTISPRIGLARVVDARQKVLVGAPGKPSVLLQQDFVKYIRTALGNGFIKAGIPTDEIYVPEAFLKPVVMSSLKEAVFYREGFHRVFKVKIEIELYDAAKNKIFERTYTGFSRNSVLMISSKTGMGKSFAHAVQEVARNVTRDPDFLGKLENKDL